LRGTRLPLGGRRPPPPKDPWKSDIVSLGMTITKGSGFFDPCIFRRENVSQWGKSQQYPKLALSSQFWARIALETAPVPSF
jgi:hypothetical protein